MGNSENIYVLISKTNTKIGKTIRFFTKQPYNHASIALDEGLNEMYSFSRTKFETPLIGGIVRETIPILTENYNQNIDVLIYKIPASYEKIREIKTFINSIYHDKEKYLYNYFGVLQFVTHKKLKVYKAYTCSEFVIEVLNYLEVPNLQKQYMLPYDIAKYLENYKFYDGKLLEYPYLDVQSNEIDIDYFKKYNTFSEFIDTAKYFLEFKDRNTSHKEALN